MLQFIFGRVSTGKTYEIMERICEDVKQGKHPVLLVTEQFSFESERTVLKHLGDKLSKNVSVVSFTRLCDEIEREVGGECGKVLDDCSKIILINRALKQCFLDLRLWKKYVSSNGFATSLLNIIAEFKLNAVTPKDIVNVSKKIDDLSLKNKLHDIALVYETYESLITERFIDPDSRLDKLYKALEKSTFFADRPVYIDSFVGFTGQQFKIIERILVLSPMVTISLTNDINDKRRFCLLSNIRKCESRIRDIAKMHNIEIGEDIYLEKRHYSNDQMLNVESVMFCGKLQNDNVGGENVTVCCAESVYDESEFVARTIRKLVREHNARYSDFVVIARDVATYEESFSNACKQNNVNCFIDRRMPLINMPPAAAALSAVELALSLSSEKILKFLKSGINILSLEEIATLENYVFVWNIKGSAWSKEWEMTPSGLVRAQDDRNQKAREQLEYINSLRKRAISPILRFKNNFGTTPKEKATAIVKLFEECGAAKAFSEIAEMYRTENSGYLDAVRQSWDMLMNCLNNLCLCFEDSQISTKEFYDAFKTSLNFETIGITPQMADEVTFGDADRIRPSRPKYAFIMGANQGVFPRSIQKGGLLNILERQKLIDNEIGISDNTTETAVDEEYLVYSNVCCPSDMLFISYSKNLSAASGEKAPFVEAICSKIECVNVNEPEALGDNNLPETTAAAFSEYCKRFSLPDGSSDTLKSAITNTDTLKHIESVTSSLGGMDFSVSKQTARKLFGSDIRLSPTGIDTFEKCRFMYFCKYGIGAKKLQSAEFNSMQRGTITHYALQMLIERFGKGIKDLCDDEIVSNVDVLCEEYLDSVEGYRMAEDSYTKYLTSTIKETLYTVVKRIRDEFSQSEFEPVRCELCIDYDGDIDPIKLAVDDDTSLTLIGKVDRIDKWNGYVRIVDYKSSYKSFTVPDILIGKNLQMLLYLYTVCRNKTFGGEPAGVFYFPTKQFKAAEKSKARMNGISLLDMSVVSAMDRENSGKFIPKMSKSGGNAQFIEPQDFDLIFGYVENRIKDTAKTILSGEITAKPLGAKNDKICEYCDYRDVCHKATPRGDETPQYKKNEALEIMGKKGE